MKLPWTPPPGMVPGPWFVGTIRHGAKVLPSDTFLLVDTGADTTTLPYDFAALLGFDPASELEVTTTNGVGGQTQIWKTKTAPPDVEIQVGGGWYAVPALHFAHNVPPLVGRDFLFGHFKLRMEHGETELRPK